MVRPDDGGGSTLLIDGFMRHDVAPSTLTSQADAVAAPAGDVEGFNADLAARHNTARQGVAGVIATAMEGADAPTKNQARSLIQGITVGAAAIRHFGSAVETFNSTIDGLNSQIRSQPTREKQREKKAALSGRHAGAVETLQSAARTARGQLSDPLDPEHVKALYAAGALPSFAPAVFSNVTNLTEVPLRVLPFDLERMTADERARYLVDRPDLADNLEKVLLGDEATADAVGRIVAEEARDLDHDSDDGDIARVAALLDRFATSDPASAAILRNLGAGDLIQTLSLAGALAYAGKEKSADLAEALRAVFRRGEPAMAGADPAESRQFARDIVDYLRGDRTGTDQPGNDPYALSYLLRDSTLSTPFLGELGNELDAFERSFEETGYTWRQMSSMGHGGAWFFDEADRDGAFDPMASYMSALGKNGEAALDFFTGTGSSDHLSPDDVQDRKEYWIQKRYWGHDDFDGLLAALDAATTTPANLSDPESARLVSEAVDYLANRRDLDSFKDSDEAFRPGDVSDDGTKHLAHMIGSYMASVDVALDEQLEDSSQLGANGLQPIFDSRIGHLENMPVFEASELRDIVSVAVSSDDGFMELRDKLTTYQNNQLIRSVQEHGVISTETSNADARLEGFFVNVVGDTEIAEAEDHDKRVQAWIDLGTEGLGIIPTPKVPGADFLIGQATNYGADALSDAYANSRPAEVDEQNGYALAARNGRQEAMEHALVNGGAITSEDVMGVLPDDASFTREDVDRWLPDGRYPTQEQYDALEPYEQRAFDSAMRTLIDDNDLGDRTGWDQEYARMFRELFE